MSDVMLIGVLRMPPDLWRDDALDVSQRHSRYIEAADRIESDAAQIESLTSENTRLREELELYKASHVRLERLYNQALGKLGLPSFEQILASKTRPPSHKGED